MRAELRRPALLSLAVVVLTATLAAGQDSLDVSFSFLPDAGQSDEVVRVFLPGEFNNWGNNNDTGRIDPSDPSRMTYVNGLGEYRYTHRLEVGRSYTYKIHYHRNVTGSDGVWLADPLNDRVVGSFNDSELVLEPLTIFQPARLTNAAGKIDTVRAWIFSVDPVLDLTFEINGKEHDGNPFLHKGSGLFLYALPEPVPAGSQLKITATDMMDRTASVEVGVIFPDVIDEPLPPGLVEGINYDEADPTRATLVLHAPGKQFVHVIGDFTGWSTKNNHVMRRDTTAPDGARFWLELTGLAAGQEYGFQYFVDGEIRIADPYAEKVLQADDRFIDESIYPDLKPYPEGETQHAVSVLETGAQPYSWTATDYRRPPQKNLVIYELLLRDFLGQHDFVTLTDTLDYLQRLGVNAIELMPVNEFQGNSSWGYMPEFYFAPDKFYGPAEDLKAFIDACHKRGIAVILDMVLNHSGGASPLVRLYNDGDYGPPTSDNPWYNRDATHPFNVGYDFNHESELTKRFVDRVNAFWLMEYRVDGFRFDLSKGFTQTQSGLDVGRWSAFDRSRVDLLTRMADRIWEVDSTAYVILEHLGDLREEQALTKHGLDQGRPGMMVWHKMSDPYAQAAMGYLSDPGRSSDLSDIYYKNRGFLTPSRVAYMESHDEQWMMYRLLRYGRQNGEYDIQFLPIALERLKLAAAFFLTVPGPKMIWQFGELGYGYGPDGRDCLRPGDSGLGECPSGTPGRTDDKPIRWEYLDDPWRAKLYKSWAAMLRLRNSHPAFTSTETELDLQVGQGEVARRIGLSHPDMDAVVVGNFGVDGAPVEPAFQQTGWWYEFFSGDSLLVAEVQDPLELLPGEFRIYTTKRFEPPEADLITVDRATDPLPLEPGVTFGLEGNFPNPFSDETTIAYGVEQPGEVTLEVFDVLGRRIAVLVDEHRSSGRFSIQWNASGIPSGTYIARLRSGDEQATTKLLITR